MPKQDRSNRALVNRRRLLIGAATGALGAAAVGAGVVASHDSSVPPSRSAAGPTRSRSADGVDSYHPSDAAFFGRLRLEGAIEVEHYATVEQMSDAASAVVVGKVLDVVPTRTIVGEGDDRVTMIGLVIQPTVLRGQLGRNFRRRLVVEFVGGPAAAATTIAKMRQELPRGEAIWFLRSKAEEVGSYRAEMKKLGRRIPKSAEEGLRTDARYYRLVSSQGLYIQGSARVDNPVADPTDAKYDPLQRRTRAIRRLSDLSRTVQRSR